MSGGAGSTGLAQGGAAVGAPVGTPASPGHPRLWGGSWLLTAGWARPSALQGHKQHGFISISPSQSSVTTRITQISPLIFFPQVMDAIPTLLRCWGFIIYKELHLGCDALSSRLDSWPQDFRNLGYFGISLCRWLQLFEIIVLLLVL